MHDPQEVPERPERARRWRRGVHPTVELLGAYSWRLIGIGIVVVAVVWLVSRLQLVLIPVVIALFLLAVTGLAVLYMVNPAKALALFQSILHGPR